MSESRTPNYSSVTVPADWAGAMVFTVPAGASDVSLSPPFGSASVESAVRPFQVAGEATGLAVDDAGTGAWSMRASGGKTAREIEYDAKVTGGPLNFLLTYWT